MISIEDCIGLSELTEDEVELIARHEHLPDIIAVELGDKLVHSEEGKARLRQWIRDEVHTAQANGDGLKAAKLKLILRHFCECHPAAERAVPPRRATERRTQV